MTTVNDRPTNGHTVTAAIPSQPLDSNPADTTDEAETAPRAVEDFKVTRLRHQLANRTTERDLSHQYVAVDGDPVFDEVRAEKEQKADREVAKKLRKKRRKERLRAGKGEQRANRRARWQRWWDQKAERTRERILDPARNLGADHRRWIASSIALFALLTGGVAYMAHTVKLGLVGHEGTWLGYLVEPLASVLLIVSLVAQFTGRQRGITTGRQFVAFDIGLVTASVLLNTVPWGVRFGFDAGSVLAHILAPGLVVAAVIGWHLASGLYGDAIANSKQDPILQDRLALLRAAVAVGELPSDASANQVQKYLRANLPTGIGHADARRVARSFLGY